MNAAAILRSARKRSGLTLRELAGRAGTSHATLAAYECGRKVPTVDTLDRIVSAAGYDISCTLTPQVRSFDPAERGRELSDVLHLAAQFPARHDRDWQAPVFGR